MTIRISNDIQVAGVPSRWGGYSWRKRQRKDIRPGWTKRVTRTVPGAKGGYMFDGPFVDNGDEVPAGSVLAHRHPDGEYRWGIVRPDGMAIWKPWVRYAAVSRKAVQAAIDNPLRELQAIHERKRIKAAKAPDDEDAQAALREWDMAMMRVWSRCLDAKGLKAKLEAMRARRKEVGVLLPEEIGP